MEYVKNNVLIFSYYFPPYPKVGSRRWAKFFKYLHQYNVNAFVLTIDNGLNEESPWDEDVKALEKNIFRLKVGNKIPFYKQKFESTFINRLLWHCSFWYNKLFAINYIPNEFNKNTIEKCYQETKRILVKYNIEKLIVSGGPFDYCHRLSSIKNELKDVSVIIDVRDPWSNSKLISEDEKIIEKEKEQETVANCDIIITPADEIKSYFTQTYNFNNVHVIPHAFDDDDFMGVDNQTLVSKNRPLRFVYAGTLYHHIQEELVTLIDLIKELNGNGVEAVLDFFTHDVTYNELLLADNAKKFIHLHTQLPAKELFTRITKEYDVVVLIYSGAQNFLSSKFYEIIRLKKPMLYVGIEGRISDFILNNQLGVHLPPNCIDKNSIITLLKEYKSDKNKLFNSNFDLEPFSLQNQTKRLIEIIS